MRFMCYGPLVILGIILILIKISGMLNRQIRNPEYVEIHEYTKNTVYFLETDGAPSEEESTHPAEPQKQPCVLWKNNSPGMKQTCEKIASEMRGDLFVKDYFSGQSRGKHRL